MAHYVVFPPSLLISVGFFTPVLTLCVVMTLLLMNVSKTRLFLYMSALPSGGGALENIMKVS